MEESLDKFNQAITIGQLDRFVALFISLLLESLPWLFLGVILSSLLLLWGNQRGIWSRLQHNSFWGACLGVALALLLPVGQYGNVPVARRMLLLGASEAVAISFLLAAPTINPLVIWVTHQVFSDRPEILILRVLLAAVVAVLVGCIFSTYQEKRLLLATPENVNLAPTSSILRSGTVIFSPNLVRDEETEIEIENSNNLVSLFFENTFKELLEFGFLWGLGCALAAIIQVYLPIDIWDLAQTTITRIFSAIIWATVIPLGSNNSVFSLAPMAPNLSKGAIAAFLLWGSWLNLKTLCLLWGTFRFKALIYLLFLLAQLVFLLTLGVDFYMD